MHQQGYWLRSRRQGHPRSEFLCYKCGAILKEFPVGEKTVQMLDELSEKERVTLAQVLWPRTITLGRPD